ncbi:hypothetical protein NPIL_220991 [Nephila pilipes]|uniref:Uncharacterized protein n=1 Tax=Nephila pilipes TaxID=299642 RepID=A0A8X6J943_NEPPI|nr:hypothetical protein NPIL_220991 [Nephila pilipes]
MEQDLNTEHSNYENFHHQFDVESIVQMMDNAYTAEALTRVINVADATLSALMKYPFEEEDKQRINIMDIEDIIDEAKNRYITARRNELRAASAVLDDTTQAWGKKLLDDDFTIVKTKKKSKNNNLEYSAKKQKIDETTPCHNKFDRLTIEDVPITSGNEMDISPPSPDRTCPRNPANHPPKQKQPQPKPENSWRKRMISAPPKQPAPRQNLTISDEDFPQLPPPTKQVQPPKPAQPSTSKYQRINNPLEMLQDPDVQELYNVLEKFVNIAKNVPTPAERLQALFKLLN